MQVRNRLFTACKIGDTDSLNEILEGKSTADKVESDPSETAASQGDGIGAGDWAKATQLGMNELLNKPFGDQERTLLHVCSLHGHKAAIIRLLEAGADPCARFVAENCSLTVNCVTWWQLVSLYEHVCVVPFVSETKADKSRMSARKQRMFETNLGFSDDYIRTDTTTMLHRFVFQKMSS